MNEIKIMIANREASQYSGGKIICGNDDYVIDFTFDEEWNGVTYKTARFQYADGSGVKYIDVLFEGTRCNVPVLINIDRVKIGVYAGDLRTTTGATVLCLKSILCDGGNHEEPDDSTYNEMMEILNAKPFDPDATVDLTYNPESQNAQSGIAVAQALSEFESESADIPDNVEITDYKVNVIDESSTYKQYPSAKATYDLVNESIESVRDDLTVEVADTFDPQSSTAQSGVAVAEAISTKQDTLESGVNIKTVNGVSLLGSGDITTTESEDAEPVVRWCAMGDSITKGAYSEYAIGQVPNPSSKETWEELKTSERVVYSDTDCWVTKLAERKKWEVVNKGVGNTGWMTNSLDYNLTADYTKDPSGFTPTDNAWKIAEGIANETVDGVKGFERFDVVTLMYGVNDWAYNRYVLGDVEDDFDFSASPTTIVAGMRKTLETIISSNPYCKIFVITPLNRRGAYNTSQGLYLEEATNWAMGFEKTNAKSLEKICEQIKKVCNYYGVEVIDMAHTSVVNRRNLPIMLPDYTHPTKDAHTVIARELTEKINFN